MAYVYDFKAVISGKEVETYKYGLTLRRGFQKGVGRGEPKEAPDLSVEQLADLKAKKTNWARNNTKTKVRRLVNTNPQLNKFFTLTFKDNITDLSVANYAFNQFVKRLSYEFKEFQYLAVPEFQKRGAVHYHLLCNLPYVPATKLEKIWGQGFINIKRIDNVKNVGAYMSKYLTKDVFKERVAKKKKFFCSQSLQKPLNLFGGSAIQFADKFLSGLAPKDERSWSSDWVGEVTFKSYLLESLPSRKDLFGN